MTAVPDPKRFARRIPLGAQMALLTAYESPGGLRVETTMQDDARPFSLIDTRTPHLSAFGLQVRAVLREQRNAI